LTRSGKGRSLKQLPERQITSIEDALRGIEGINVRPLDARDGKTGNQSISLRGLPREYTLILIDGVRQNPMGNITPNSFNDSQSVFIPAVAAIERIEVIRGPMSTLYGSDALGGVVNIVTRKPGTEWGGSATANRTFQTDSDFGDKSVLELYASGPVVADTLSLQLYGRFFDRQGSDIRIPGVSYPRQVTDDTPTMGQNPVPAENYTLGGKLLFTPDAQNDLFLDFNSARGTSTNRRTAVTPRAVWTRAGATGTWCWATSRVTACSTSGRHTVSIGTFA
jgi:outer membrane receptor for ferrienterochelin and colicins